MIKPGSRWYAHTREQVFVVIDSREIEGNQWVYYRNERGDPPREYSCFQESFEHRFTPIVE
jgi:hypothetical protein